MLLPEMRPHAAGRHECQPVRVGRARGSPHGKAVGNHLLASAIPFQVSQDAVGGHRYGLREAAECRLGAPRGDRRPERSAIQRPSAGGYLLLLFASELAIGQSSTEPIQRLPGRTLEAIARRPTDANPPGRPR